MDKKQIIEELREEGALLGLKDEELANYVRTEFKDRERIERGKCPEEREEKKTGR